MKVVWILEVASLERGHPIGVRPVSDHTCMDMKVTEEKSDRIGRLSC